MTTESNTMTISTDANYYSGLTVPSTELTYKPPRPSRLYEKIYNVMRDIGWLEKDSSVNVGGGGWAYTSEAQFLAEMRPLFVENRLIMLPVGTRVEDVKETEKQGGKFSYLTTIVMYYRIIDIDSGDGVEIMVPAQGQDAGDKGVYKAVTGAYKYAMRQAFMVGTGDDPERTDEDGNVVATTAPKKTNVDQAQSMVREIYKKVEGDKIVVDALKKQKISLLELPTDTDVLKAMYMFAKSVVDDKTQSEKYAKTFHEEVKKVSK